jgi:hypothetical protein
MPVVALSSRPTGWTTPLSADPDNRFGRQSSVRVYGCSPGCLLMSLGVSLLLTIVVNVLIRLL